MKDSGLGLLRESRSVYYYYYSCAVLKISLLIAADRTDVQLPKSAETECDRTIGDCSGRLNFFSSEVSPITMRVAIGTTECTEFKELKKTTLRCDFSMHSVYSVVTKLL